MQYTRDITNEHIKIILYYKYLALAQLWKGDNNLILQIRTQMPAEVTQLFSVLTFTAGTGGQDFSELWASLCG